MTLYYKCNMTPLQHALAYIIGTLAASAVVYIFYHLLFPSVVIGALLGIYLEKMFAASTVRKRQRNLRLQFRTFLESMSVATRAGNTEIKAMESALDDLRISYRPDADIVVEIENILTSYKNGGIQLRTLFDDFADRSDLEDIRSFASIYNVIEGRNDRIGSVLADTSEIIGDKIEIEQEIETTITSAKSETTMMLILPIVIVLCMSLMGGELMSSLYSPSGYLASTIELIIFIVSYVIAVRASQIDV